MIPHANGKPSKFALDFGLIGWLVLFRLAPYSRGVPGYEVFDHRERAAVDAVFQANGGVLFAHGFEAIRNDIFRVREYEQAFAEYFNFPHAQAVSSGSAALKIALECAGVLPGDEVIIPAHTFIATAEAVLQVGAVPVVVDIDESLNMDPKAFERAVTSRTRAVVPVHMMGEMADMTSIAEIAQRLGLTVIEDCAQALGATLGGVPAGSFSRAAAFSTDAGKTLCTGEGGMVVTFDANDHVHARARHDHGHAYDVSVPRGLDPAISTGFNYRLTELQAAIGIVQLEKLSDIIERQRKNKFLLMESLRGLPVEFRKTSDPDGDLGDTVVMLLGSETQAQRVSNKLASNGFGTKNLPSAMRWHFASFWPHLLGEADGRWEKSQAILERSLALAVSVTWSVEDVERLSDAVHSAVSEAVQQL